MFDIKKSEISQMKLFYIMKIDNLKVILKMTFKIT